MLKYLFFVDNKIVSDSKTLVTHINLTIAKKGDDEKRKNTKILTNYNMNQLTEIKYTDICLQTLFLYFFHRFF